MPNALNERGFTLVELMITVALLAIVATIAVPNFTQFIRNNQVQAKAEELMVFLQYARGEAVTQRRSYQVNVGSEWQVQPASGGAVVRTLQFNTQQAQARSSINTITFLPSGIATATAQVTVCREADADNGYFIEIQRSGLIRMQARGVSVPNSCEVQ